MPPEERIKAARGSGRADPSAIQEEFETGVSVGWHRVPWSHGCYGLWTDETRNQHYEPL